MGRAALLSLIPAVIRAAILTSAMRHRIAPRLAAPPFRLAPRAAAAVLAEMPALPAAGRAALQAPVLGPQKTAAAQEAQTAIQPMADRAQAEPAVRTAMVRPAGLVAPLATVVLAAAAMAAARSDQLRQEATARMVAPRRMLRQAVRAARLVLLVWRVILAHMGLVVVVVARGQAG